MKITITDKNKKDIFVSLFNVLKNCSSTINATFEHEKLHIQGMDKSHVCLFDVKLNKNWFSTYDVLENIKISFDAIVFHSIISSKSDGQNLNMYMSNNNQDVFHIDFESNSNISKKGNFNKKFKMNLTDYEYEEMAIPNVDYESEFTISSKQITDMFSQLINFGDNIIIRCSEENIQLTTNGDIGEMQVEVCIDDLTNYTIIEHEEFVTFEYSLLYINKMCITNKISNEIDFSLSSNCPMKISYNLGDNSYVEFYIAPKLSN